MATAKKLPTTVTHKEVMQILSVSKPAAQKRLVNIRFQLSKDRNKPILLAEYCRAEQLNYEDVVQILLQ